MHWTGKIGETLRALAVLALFFLNFAHVPLSAAPADAYAPLSIASICGDPMGDDRSGDHAPCHACRIGAGLDLAPPCPVTQPVLAETAITYAALPSAAAPHLPLLTARARAPPTA